VVHIQIHDKFWMLTEVSGGHHNNFLNFDLLGLQIMFFIPKVQNVCRNVIALVFS
jgi:hypothetical protein